MADIDEAKASRGIAWRVWTSLNMTKATLLDSLSQYYVSLDIENELLSSTTKFTLLDSLRQDSDLSIKAYSLLQEVCINCFKSKYMLVF